jgi:hypothetical protein
MTEAVAVRFIPSLIDRQMLVGRLRRRWNAGLDAFYGGVRQCLIATDYQSPADPRSTAHSTDLSNPLLVHPCTAKTISMVYADGSMKKRQLISFLGLECQEIEQKCRVGFKTIRARCALRLAQFARLHPWLSPRRFGNLPNNKPATILP